MRIRALAIIMAAVLLAATGAVFVILTRPLPETDVAELNDLRAQAELVWPVIDTETFPSEAPPLTVLSSAGEILFTSARSLNSELSATRNNAHVLTISPGGTQRGLLLVESSFETAVSAKLRDTFTAITITLAIIGLLIASALAWLNWRVLRPFRRLQGFAERVATGDLDSPLPMDRNNVFGAFSESFDLMRTELRRARTAERTVREENREVLAQLGHDIRTPVAIIAATAEVLEVAEAEPKRLEQLGIIRNRSEQIDALVGDLIRTSKNDLVELTVHVEPHTSLELAELIRQCDPNGCIASVALPECIVDYDPDRMRQVVDNILSNTHKFADTAVSLSASIVTAADSVRMLQLCFDDDGPGVPPSELSAILAQGVRGSNSAHVPGSGLGLYISGMLMERMGGELIARNSGEETAGGFSITGFRIALLLPLTGDGLSAQHNR